MAFQPDQITLPTILCPIANASEILANEGGIEARGAIFTRIEVVDFILDLAGYTEDRPLHTMRVLEPSSGAGDFLLPIIRRLLNAWRAAEPDGLALESLSNAVRAIELHRQTFEETGRKVIALLEQEGLTSDVAEALTKRWLVQGDFLLAALDGTFDFVLGNPPYVRQELIPAPLLAEYRRRYQTLYDRADLYIPFIERSLTLQSSLLLSKQIKASKDELRNIRLKKHALVALTYNLSEYHSPGLFI